MPLTFAPRTSAVGLPNSAAGTISQSTISGGTAVIAGGCVTAERGSVLDLRDSSLLNCSAGSYGTPPPATPSAFSRAAPSAVSRATPSAAFSPSAASACIIASYFDLFLAISAFTAASLI